jgi:quercetin dioxygenase-like cupin family protein
MAAINWDKIPIAGGMRAGSTRQAIAAEQISAVRVETKPDAVFDGKAHWHENDQMLVMVSGRVKLEVDGDRFEVGPGDLVFFPPGSRHAAVGVGPEGCVYYELFAPSRVDQLPGWIGPTVLRFDQR